MPPPASSIKGGQFAGFDNYKTWLLQQCPTPGGGTVKCPPGTLGLRILELGRIHAWASPSWRSLFETVIGMIIALMMNKAFKGRGVVRAAILDSVGDPDRGHRQAVAGHLRARAASSTRFSAQHHMVGEVAGPYRHRHHRHLEDDPVHGLAHPGRVAGHSG